MNKLMNWFKTKQQLSNECFDWKIRYNFLRNLIKISDSIEQLRERISNPDEGLKESFKVTSDLQIMTGHWAIKLFAIILNDYMKANEADNYVTTDILTSGYTEDDGSKKTIPCIVVTVQRKYGETPAQALNRLKARVKELEDKQCLESKDTQI